MSKIRLRYIQAFVDRKTGATFHYFRRAGFPLVRLPDLPGSAEFIPAYEDALAAHPRRSEPSAASRAACRTRS